MNVTNYHQLTCISLDSQIVYEDKTLCIDLKEKKDLNFLHNYSNVTSLKIKNADGNFNFGLFNLKLKSLEIENSRVNLSELNLSYLENLKIVKCEKPNFNDLKFPELKFFQINNCRNIDFQNSDFSNLKFLKITQCDTLNLESLKSSSLLTIKVDSCRKIIFQNLYFPSLNCLYVNDCQKFYLNRSRFTNLKSLEFFGIKLHIEDVDFSKLESCKILDEKNPMTLVSLKKYFNDKNLLKNKFNFLLNLKGLKYLQLSSLQFEFLVQDINQDLINFIEENKIEINMENRGKCGTDLIKLLNYISHKYRICYVGKTKKPELDYKQIFQSHPSILELQETGFLSDFICNHIDVELLELAFKAGADLEFNYSHNNSLLNNSIKLKPKLSEFKSDPVEYNSNLLKFKTNLMLVKKLIELGADLHHKNKSNISPFDRFCECYFPYRLLLKEQVLKYFEQIDENNEKAAISLIKNFKDYKEMEKYCPELNAQVFMNRAIEGQCFELVKVLLEKGMNLSEQMLINIEFARNIKQNLENNTSTLNFEKKLKNIEKIILLLSREDFHNVTINSPEFSSHVDLLNNGKLKVHDLVKNLTESVYEDLTELEKLIIFFGRENCKKITGLDLSGYDKKNYLSLKKFPLLKNLTLDKDDLEGVIGIEKIILNECKKEKVNFSSLKGPSHFHVKKSEHMESLCIIRTSSLEKLLIEDCPNFTDLSAVFSKSAENSVLIKSCNNLESLELENVQLKFDFSFLKDCKNFRSCTLRDIDFFDFKNLNFCPNIKYLAIVNAEELIFDKQDNRTIETLYLSSCKLKDTSFLKHFKQVKKLGLRNNPEIEDFGFLLDSVNLEELSLSKNQFENFYSYYSKNPNIRKKIIKQKIKIFIENDTLKDYIRYFKSN